MFCSAVCKNIRTREDDERRFIDLYVPDQATGCFLWQGAADPNGYGRFRIRGRTVLAHRFSYESAHGSLPDAPLLRHRCDTPRCVNPDHLEPGDHFDNAQDMVARGNVLRGERANSVRLTEAQVRQIRATRRTDREWAEEFRVDRKTISAVRRHLTWTHV